MINMDAKSREEFIERAEPINRELRPKLNAILALIDRGQRPESKDFKKYYRSEEVKELLEDIYRKKCVFCEKKPESLDVDHYRPKAKVRGFDGKKTSPVKDENDECHPGYYWLAYEITNLLLLCRECNRGKGGKYNKFPVQGIRIFKHPEDESQWRVDCERLLNEKPLLLHPFVDLPEDHITIDSSGEAIPVNGSDKGDMTIGTCNLNRDGLWLDRRKKIIDDLFREMKVQLLKFDEDLKNNEIINLKKSLFSIFEQQFSKLKKNKVRDCQFSRVYRCMYEYFDEFLGKNSVTMDLTPTDKSFIKKSFSRFKDNAS